MTDPGGGPVSERIDGPTPNGGTYSIVYFIDRDGLRCPKGRAVAMEITEYDAGDAGSFALTWQGRDGKGSFPDGEP